MRRLAPLALALCLALPRNAPADTLHFDLEVDPLAYAFGGHSLHVGLGWEHLRLDLGAFAMEMPAVLHGNEGFTAAFDGFGAKLQLFPFAAQSGPFVGVGAGRMSTLVQRNGTDLAARDTHFSAGAQVGWRIDLGAGFFATPWLGVDHTFGLGDVELGDARFETGSWTFFPTVHLGYRIR